MTPECTRLDCQLRDRELEALKMALRDLAEERGVRKTFEDLYTALKQLDVLVEDTVEEDRHRGGIMISRTSLQALHARLKRHLKLAEALTCVVTRQEALPFKRRFVSLQLLMTHLMSTQAWSAPADQRSFDQRVREWLGEEAQRGTTPALVHAPSTGCRGVILNVSYLDGSVGRRCSRCQTQALEPERMVAALLYPWEHAQGFADPEAP